MIIMNYGDWRPEARPYQKLASGSLRFVFVEYAGENARVKKMINDCIYRYYYYYLQKVHVTFLPASRC